jgi:hypothetical protein
VTLNYSDSEVKGDQAYGLVMSTKFIYLVTKTLKILWSIAVSTISHVAFIYSGQQFSLQFVEYSLGKGESPSSVFFNSKNAAVNAYDSFVRFRDRFGNSTIMEPSDVILNQFSHSSHGSQSTSPSASNGVIAASKDVHIQEYTFGSANNRKCKNERLSDKEFKLIADRYFSKLQVPIPIPIEAKRDYHQYLDEIV